MVCFIIIGMARRRRREYADDAFAFYEPVEEEEDDDDDEARCADSAPPFFLVDHHHQHRTTKKGRKRKEMKKARGGGEACLGRRFAFVYRGAVSPEVALFGAQPKQEEEARHKRLLAEARRALGQRRAHAPRPLSLIHI